IPASDSSCHVSPFPRHSSVATRHRYIDARRQEEPMSSTRLTRREFVFCNALALTAAFAATATTSRPARAATLAWKQLAPDAPVPVPSPDHPLSADDEAKQLLVFGGRDADHAPLGDPWLFDLDARTWTQVDGDAPAPRFGHAVAVDQRTRRLYLF